MKYKHIIFDFNGTLVDSRNVIDDILNGLIIQSRFKNLSPKDFEKIRNLSLGKKIKVILFFARYQREFMKLLHKNISRINFACGVKEMLELMLENNIEFSILSSNRSEMIIDFFKLHGISVKQIHQSQRLFGKKKALKKIIKQNRCKSRDILYICDEKRDADACNRCGVNVIVVGWGLGDSENLTEMKLNIIQTPAQLAEFLIDNN